MTVFAWELRSPHHNRHIFCSILYICTLLSLFFHIQQMHTLRVVFFLFNRGFRREEGWAGTPGKLWCLKTGKISMVSSIYHCTMVALWEQIRWEASVWVLTMSAASSTGDKIFKLLTGVLVTITATSLAGAGINIYMNTGSRRKSPDLRSGSAHNEPPMQDNPVNPPGDAWSPAPFHPSTMLLLFGHRRSFDKWLSTSRPKAESLAL